MDKFFYIVFSLISLWYWVEDSPGLAASISPGLLKAKQEAEAKGYIFVTSKDEIIAKAKQEGKLRVSSTLDSEVIKAMRDAFRKTYPFIDIRVEELGSVEDNQRFLLEVKAGMAKAWDVNRLYTEFYEEYLPYQKKFDILDMAQQKVLNLPPNLVDPSTRNVVTVSSNINVIAYNRKLLSEDKVPETWEDFLKPEFKGRKFVADIRPISLAMLVPAWGLEKTVEFARKLAAQDPVWGRGHARVITSVLTGENAVFLGPNFGSVKGVQKKDPTGVLGYRILEPVPIRLHEGNAVLASAEHPYGALLWLEFLMSHEGQKILDEHGPFAASAFTPGSVQEQLTRGKKLSIGDWNHYGKLNDYMSKIVEAMGFPKAK